MLRELLLSLASGIIATLILQAFGFSDSRGRGQRQSINTYGEPSRRGGFLAGVFRLVAAVVGGVALAYVAAPFVFARRFGDYGSRGRYDRFDGLDSIASHAPMLVLTVISTIIVWALLSALSRR